MEESKIYEVTGAVHAICSAIDTLIRAEKKDNLEVFVEKLKELVSKL